MSKIGSNKFNASEKLAHTTLQKSQQRSNDKTAAAANANSTKKPAAKKSK